jgi:hypothetical protein
MDIVAARKLSRKIQEIVKDWDWFFNSRIMFIMLASSLLKMAVSKYSLRDSGPIVGAERVCRKA